MKDTSNKMTPRILKFSEDRPIRTTRRSINIQEVHYGSACTTLTPSRNVTKQYAGTDIDDEVQKRRKICKGNIAFRVGLSSKGGMSIDGAGARGRCVLCSMKTHYFCLDCHHFLNK